MSNDLKPPPRRILIILMGSIGDVARALPLAAQLRGAYPESFISWLIEPKSAPLLESNQYLDRIFIFERNVGISAFTKVIREVRSHKFDLVLDLQRHLKSGVASLLSGAKRRIGFHRRNSKEFNWIFNTEQIAYRDEAQSKLEHYLDFLRYLKVPIELPLEFGLEPNDELFSEWVTKLKDLPPPLIGLVLGSTWSSKDWFGSGYQKLIQILLEGSKGTIVLLGDSSKVELAHSLETNGGSLRIYNTVGKTSLRELIFILSKLRLVIGPDSGPGHISAALKVPHITLFGPTLPSRVAPLGMEELSVRSAIGCSPCGRKVCPGLNRLCMRLISPEVVAHSAFRIIR